MKQLSSCFQMVQLPRNKLLTVHYNTVLCSTSNRLACEQSQTSREHMGVSFYSVKTTLNYDPNILEVRKSQISQLALTQIV